MDGAKVHGPLKAALVAAGAQVVPHPPYSPDLNPIENLWATLKEKVSRNGPLPVGKLKEALEASWKEIKSSDFKKYAASMQGRLAAVIELGGEHTKY
jgi:transposase